VDPFVEQWKRPSGRVKFTRYFQEQVLRKRPYISAADCRSVVAWPLRRLAQPDGRIRF
jgi:hypothetical protein